MKYRISHDFTLWHIVLPLLIATHLVYLHHNLFSWFITLGVFLIVPGYLLLRRLGVSTVSGWVTYSLSVGLSISAITIAGLALNTFHYLGFTGPLQTIPIFIVLDVLCLGLLYGVRGQKVIIGIPRFSLGHEEKIYAILIALLPLLAIGGAFRLNNSASNILTMILFGAISVIFAILVIRPVAPKLYPYAIFSTATALLLCLSLRGWSITGHDIHHEFTVFTTAMDTGFWRARTPTGDPYAACLSITILPTILYNITGIEPIYIFKVVFQLIFASLMPLLYFLARKFVSPKQALIAAFAFITFPTFTNDLPFLNRQEIAFGYFLVLLYVNFSKLSHRVKTFLTVQLLLTIIMSHYSTSYASVSLLLLAFIIFSILRKLYKHKTAFASPLLSLPIIIMAFLATFVWNAQITASSSNLSSTLSSAVQGFLRNDTQAAGSLRYNLLSASASNSPAALLAEQAEKRNLPIMYAPPAQLPLTTLGKFLSGFFNVPRANFFIHAIIAKILQLLVITGVVVLLIRFRRKESKTSELYLLSLGVSCIGALVIFTLFPQLSNGYDVTRLFQQSMMVLWLPLLASCEWLFAWLGRRAIIGTTLLLVLLFSHLSGFVPQLTGGYLPQLTLNNSGLYFDYFYTHESDIVATNWMGGNHLRWMNVFMDTNASAPPKPYPVATGFISGAPQGYYYTEYINNTRGIYRSFAGSGFAEYTNPAIIANKSMIYSNGSTKVYIRWGQEQ